MTGATDAGQRLVRHRLPDRLYHWLMAACVLALLLTGLLPVAGVKLAWVTPHWIVGLALTALVALHVVRSLVWLERDAMLIGPRDVRDGWRTARFVVGGVRTGPPKPGKYTLAQKLYHLAAAIVVLAAVATGLLMMVKIDTPWWKRDPYWLADQTWGIVYIVHDLATMLLVTMIMVHVYFALRPEKLWFTRSMIRGWITREEYLRQHDPERWPMPPELVDSETETKADASRGGVAGD